MDDLRLTRRATLGRLVGFAALLATGGWRAAFASGTPVSCILTPEQTEGPYYVAGERVRRNITEDRPGTPLLLKTIVVDASTCKPIKGASVDVWHADALGVYSGVQGNSGTFMRGIQKTDANGLASFLTVYPGWYQGRTVHIHVKVHIGGNVVHTGQLYFPDMLTDRAYAKAPYSSRPNRTTRNANDSVFVNGGSKSLLHVKASGTGYAAAITMGVVR